MYMRSIRTCSTNKTFTDLKVGKFQTKIQLTYHECAHHTWQPGVTSNPLVRTYETLPVLDPATSAAIWHFAILFRLSRITMSPRWQEEKGDKTWLILHARADSKALFLTSRTERSFRLTDYENTVCILGKHFPHHLWTGNRLLKDAYRNLSCQRYQYVHILDHLGPAMPEPNRAVTLLIWKYTLHIFVVLFYHSETCFTFISFWTGNRLAIIFWIWCRIRRPTLTIEDHLSSSVR